MTPNRRQAAGKVTTNSVIGEMIDRKRVILKTMTRRGVVYTYADSLKVIPADVAERLIEKKIVVGDGCNLEPGAAGQTFRLSQAWGGTEP